MFLSAGQSMFLLIVLWIVCLIGGVLLWSFNSRNRNPKLNTLGRILVFLALVPVLINVVVHLIEGWNYLGTINEW